MSYIAVSHYFALGERICKACAPCGLFHEGMRERKKERKREGERKRET